MFPAIPAPSPSSSVSSSPEPIPLQDILGRRSRANSLHANANNIHQQQQQVDTDDERGGLLEDGQSRQRHLQPSQSHSIPHQKHHHTNSPLQPSNILLPSSLLPLSSVDDLAASPTNPISSSLVFASSQYLDPSSTHPSPTMGPRPPTAMYGGNSNGNGGSSWMDNIMGWIVPSPRGHIDEYNRYSAHFQDEPLSPTVHSNASTPSAFNGRHDVPLINVAPVHTSSSNPFLGSYTPSVIVSFLQTVTLWSILFFMLFVFVYAFEMHLDSGIRQQRMALIELPESDRISIDYATLISTSEQALSKQRELNLQLQLVNERDALIHTLHAELANRDEVLTSYKKVVQRLKTLQYEHEESERKVREAAAVQMLETNFQTAVGTPEAHLSKYKEQLLRLIFGNKTLEESRREHSESRSANEEEILRLVAEEKSDRSKHIGDLLRGVGSAQTELKIESVMRVQELGGHFSVDEDEDHSQNEHDPQSSSKSDTSPGGVGGNSKSQAPADKLVDSAKNEYILSKPGDSSKKTVDTRLVMDLGIVIVASAIGGLLASAARQPILLGYLLGGSFIGPGGAHLIGQFIQIETLAQFGATFLLFALGVEFSVSKLRKVKHIAVVGGGLQLIVIMFVVASVGAYVFDMKVKQAIFVGCVLSMSSTTVVVKSLMERKQIATLCGQVMLGLLIVQDLFLSLMLALLNLAKVPLDRLGEELAWLGLKFVVLGAIVVGCMYLWPICLRLLDQSKSHDLFLLGLVALCVFLTVVSEKIIASAEVGAFLSGILISSSPGASSELTHRSLRLFGPIRDMFGALFFCSIGMLINPFFLVEKAPTIILLVFATILLKSTITFIIVRLFGYRAEIAVRTGFGLSQIGEFAFVLVSEGVSVGLLSKDLYFLLLGTTAVSIFVTPALLHFAEWLVRRLQLAERHD